MALAALLLCLPCGCRPKKDKAPPTSRPGPARRDAADTVPAEALSPVRVWWEEAKRADVPPNCITRVDQLLLVACPEAELPWSVERTVELRTSLREFLHSEAPCFREEHAAAQPESVGKRWLVEGKCYWAAWLLAEAVRRLPATEARSRATAESFQGLVAEVIKPLAPALAGQVRRELLRRFTALHRDMLFPGLKVPITPSEQHALAVRIVAAHKALLAGVDGVKEDQAPFLVNRVLSELAYDATGPSQTEYWGRMKLADYVPDRPRWPLSLAFVPDEELNRLIGWSRRDGAPRSAGTRPGAPSTAPGAPGPTTVPGGSTVTPPAGTLESEWSPAVGGVRGRLAAGAAVAKRLEMQVAVQLWSVGDTAKDIDLAFEHSLRWRLTGPGSKELLPTAIPRPAAQPRWYTLKPGRAAGRIAGRTRWDDKSGPTLELGLGSWTMLPGKYRLQGTLKVTGADAKAAGRADGPLGASAWVGELPLAPVEFEVFPEVTDEALRTAVSAARAKHGGREKEQREKLWGALADLVTPGMTPQQMEIALPPAVRQKPRIEDRGGYFFVSYPLDLDFDVKAVGAVVGAGKGERVLTARPVLLPRPPGP